jgi:hypothetical protein
LLPTNGELRRRSWGGGAGRLPARQSTTFGTEEKIKTGVDSVASRWPTGEEKREGRLVGAAWRRGRGVATRSEEGMGGGAWRPARRATSGGGGRLGVCHMKQGSGGRKVVGVRGPRWAGC